MSGNSNRVREQAVRTTMSAAHGAAAGFAPAPSHRVVAGYEQTGPDRRLGRTAVVVATLACLAAAALWVGRAGGADDGVGASADELLAGGIYGAARAQLRQEAVAVTKQLYAAEDQDAKTGFRVAKDQALVQQLESKAERISAQLKGGAAVRKPAREMMLARKSAFAGLEQPDAPAKMVSLKNIGAIIKAVEGQDRAKLSSQPINVNIYLPSAASRAPEQPTSAQLAAHEAKNRAAVRLQLKEQDAQIKKILAETRPKEAAAQLSLSNPKIKAALSSAVSDEAARLHQPNPITQAAQLGVANPLASDDETETAKAVAAKNAASKPEAVTAHAKKKSAMTPAEAKAAHLKKIMEIDGLLLKSKHKAELPAKARIQELADGSARAQLADAEQKEEAMRHHHQLVQQLSSMGETHRSPQGDNHALDNHDVSRAFFDTQRRKRGGRLSDEHANALKHNYHKQMYELDQAAGDAEHMKITGSIRDLIPNALFDAMNRQNAIHELAHPAERNKGFPARQNNGRVFGHDLSQLHLPDDNDVIKENDRMLTGLEAAAGVGSRTSSRSSGDGWGKHYSHHGSGWNSKRWLGDEKAVDDERPLDDDSIPVLSDGWGTHDFDKDVARDPSASGTSQGLASWKNQLKSSEDNLGFKGLMAEQPGHGSRHSELEDAQTAAQDGWLRR